MALDEDYSYFILSKTVDAGGIGIHYGGHEKVFRGKAIYQLERLMTEDDINMIWCGHISQNIEKEVLSLTETKLAEDDTESELQKRVFSILVELLDNVANYSPGKEAEKQFGMPVAVIKFADKYYSITTGNLIENTQVDHLKEKIDIINRYDKPGLKKFYIKSLSGQTVHTDSTGNMGLIDMARKSGSRLHYQFKQINERYSYYIVTVKVSDRRD